jgi:ribosomal protein S18 acetylase RimI-like enzyme
VRKKSGIGEAPPQAGRRESHASATGLGSPSRSRLPIPDSRFPIPDSRPAIRRATADDLPVIVSLRMALLREHAHNTIYSRLRPDADTRAARLFAAQLQSPNEVIFLAELDGECVGILRCIHSAGSPLMDPAQYGYVSSVYVVPKARERGVLRALLAAADEWCADRGLDEMRLHNAADNPLANAAWEALGFEVVEHLRVRSLKG